MVCSSAALGRSQIHEIDVSVSNKVYEAHEAIIEPVEERKNVAIRTKNGIQTQLRNGRV